MCVYFAAVCCAVVVFLSSLLVDIDVFDLGFVNGGNLCRYLKRVEGIRDHIRKAFAYTIQS